MKQPKHIGQIIREMIDHGTDEMSVNIRRHLQQQDEEDNPQPEEEEKEND